MEMRRLETAGDANDEFLVVLKLVAETVDRMKHHPEQDEY